MDGQHGNYGDHRRQASSIHAFRMLFAYMALLETGLMSPDDDDGGLANLPPFTEIST